MDPATCPDNEVYNQCPAVKCDAEYCPKSRDDPLTCPTGTKCDAPRCTCAFNTHRDRKTGKCIPTRDCPPFECDRANEEYQACPAKCPSDQCADYLKNTTCGAPLGTRIGIVVPCAPQCRCKEGYYRDSNGECVEPDQCSQECPKNEVYSSCIQGECRALNCSQLGVPISCPRIDPQQCIKGCICAEGYLRDETGKCVPNDKCPNGCGGDPNARPGCGTYCGHSCTDYNKTVGCPKICKVNSCDCKEGYVYDRNVQKCVLPGQCTLQCTGENEEYNACPGVCPLQTCSSIGQKIFCPRQPVPGSPNCKPACRCKPNFYRNAENVCVSKDDCLQCTKPNEVYDKCAPNCPPDTCDSAGKIYPCPLQPASGDSNCAAKCRCVKGFYRNSTDACPANEVYNQCPPVKCDAEYCPKSRDDALTCPAGKKCDAPRCTCAFNTHRDRKTGKCIPTRECPPFECDRANEEYQACPAKCPSDQCADYLKNTTCGAPLGTRIGIVVPCAPQCRCKEGYYRDSNGECIEPDQCSQECPKNEVYSSCIQGECRALNCSQLGVPISCPRIDPQQCIKGCICAEGYLRDETGKCVPNDKCPNGCGGDPNARPGCGTYCGRSCTDYNKTVACPEICQLNGCDCKEGYVYDRNIGKCVLPEQCNSCPDNEVYNQCPPVKCDAEYCPKSRDDPLTCPTGTKCDSPRCTCAFNTHRDRKTGKCIPTRDCPPFECDRANEEYQACPAKCPSDQCADYLKNTTCGAPLGTRIGIVVPCAPQCRCKEGYYRDSNGECVEPDQCSNGCGGDPNAKPGCGTYCGRSCTDYNKTVACPLICKLNACDCKEGYAYDRNIGKCVLPEQCTLQCTGQNEVYNSCPVSCPSQACANIGQIVFCPRQPTPGSPDCKPACTCKPNFYRNAENVCVSKDDCLQCTKPNEVYDKCASTCSPESCPENEVYNTCPTVKCDADYCPKSANDRATCPVGITCDPPRCTCGFNSRRDRKTGKCIPTRNCRDLFRAIELQKSNTAKLLDLTFNQFSAPFPCNGPNEKYDACPPVCPGQNCSDYINKSTCPKYRIGIVVPCKPQCRCVEGYYRDENNRCVSGKQCLADQYGHNSDNGDSSENHSEENNDGENYNTGSGEKTSSQSTHNCEEGNEESNSKEGNTKGSDDENSEGSTKENDSTESAENTKSSDTSTNAAVAETKLLKGINEFSAKLFEVVSKKNPGKSVVMAPISILFAVAPLGLYSEGKTHKQILEALNLGNNSEVRAAFPILINNLLSQQKVELKVANKIYFGSNSQIPKSFFVDTRDVFKAEAENVDFDQPQETADKINEWVELITNNNIKDLISPKVINHLTKMVLANAMYFYGNWTSPFDKRNTQLRDYHVDSNTVVQKQIMYKQGSYKYAESSELDCKILEIPYQGGNLSMTIWLPNSVEGLATLTEKLSNSDLSDKALSQLRQVTVKVYLPLMNITTSLDLKEPLTECDLGQMFNTDTDLKRLSENSENLKVTDAIHKAMIEVNESGTKAAAATVTVLGDVGAGGRRRLRGGTRSAQHTYGDNLIPGLPRRVRDKWRCSGVIPADPFLPIC
ncbi:Antichymotrypsin-2 [Eumeta japonica]|uniref:Antichymotrypsin-2 n=1 Tax=Eumeta variegata TaxID=151549 RepID=A0A4C1WU72_EUMVA|nr:Antichymotrypsin-2 [Eumeta japonica]